MSKKIAWQEFKIEAGIRLPATRSSYPWGEMTVGDSFLLKWPEGLTDRQRENLRSSITGSARHVGMKSITRNTPEGLRVWRVE